MAFEACRNPSVGFADSSPASGGAFNSLSQTFGLPAPSVREPFGQSLDSYVKPPSLREEDASATSRRRESACPERGGGCEWNEQTEGL